jgi:hypothetical protein
LRNSGTPVKIALIWTKCRSVSAASSRAMVVLPTPGGPQNTRDGERTGIEHHAQAALWPENVILADYIRKPRRAQTVRQGPRPGVVGIGALRFCVEQISHQGHRLTPPVHWHQCILLAIDTK